MTKQELEARTADSLKAAFFVALQYPVADEAAMLEHMAEHLDYMAEREGAVFLSGPLPQEGVLVGEGLTVLKTADEAEARAFMDAEPLIRRGLRRYELKRWRVQEGSLSLTISGVHSSVTLG